MVSLKLTLTELAQYSGKPGIGAAATYAAFLDAVAAKSFDGMWKCASERLRADLKKMRRYPDFPVLFGLWCETYPRMQKLLSVRHDDMTALVDVQGDVAGERVHVCATLIRIDGTWQVDKEYFGDQKKTCLSLARNMSPSSAILLAHKMFTTV